MSYNLHSSPWYAIPTEQLLGLWLAGRTKQEIADALGMSREAVVGRIYRLRRQGINFPRRDKVA